MTDAPSAATLDRIRALLKLAEDGAATAAEAELALAKATEMLARYNLDQDTLAATDPGSDRIADKIFTVTGSYAMGRYNVLALVARDFDVRTVRIQRRRGRGLPGGAVEVHLFGMSHKIEALLVLHESLMIQLNHAMIRDKGRTADSLASPRTWARDYMVAFGQVVSERLLNQRRTAERQHTAAGGTSTDLVRREQADQIEAYMRNKIGNTSSSGSRTLTTSGVDQGAMAGMMANLGGSSLGVGRRALGS